jgi:hypothetical protein
VPAIKNIEKKNIFGENPVEVRSFDGTIFSKYKQLGVPLPLPLPRSF